MARVVLIAGFYEVFRNAHFVSDATHECKTENLFLALLSLHRNSQSAERVNKNRVCDPFCPVSDWQSHIGQGRLSNAKDVPITFPNSAEMQ